jgi:hypothetical protein
LFTPFVKSAVLSINGVGRKNRWRNEMLEEVLKVLVGLSSFEKE